MADPRFFDKQGSLKLKDVVRLSGAALGEGVDPEIVIDDVGSLEQADAGQVSFLDNVKYKQAFAQTSAGAVFVRDELKAIAPSGTAVLISDNPYRAYALTAQHFYPQAILKENISKDAHIAKSAKIGKNCVIEPGAVIMDNVEIGDYCKIGANAVISHAIIGSYVSIYRGACIGQDGFGFAIDPKGFVKVPQLGRVIIEDHVEIGANTTIDRGAGPDTVIGAGTWIDNLVQIGHNVKIGKGCVIVSQVGISGSTVLEDYVMIGGQAGLAGHLRVGKGVKIAAQSGIMRDIPAGSEVMGSPAIPIRQFMRQTATLNRLVKKDK